MDSGVRRQSANALQEFSGSSNTLSLFGALWDLENRVVFTCQRYRTGSPRSWIGIFGSVARGEQTESSDIDILVEFSRPVVFFTFLELEEYLSMRLGAPVDLVTPDALKPLIREQMAAEVAYA